MMQVSLLVIGGSGHQTDLKKGWATICRAAGITGLWMQDRNCPALC
jgi:hypothetical protein